MSTYRQITNICSEFTRVIDPIHNIRENDSISWQSVQVNQNCDSQSSHVNIQNNANGCFHIRVRAQREKMSSYNIHLLLDIQILDLLLIIKQFLLWCRCSMINQNNCYVFHLLLIYVVSSLLIPLHLRLAVFFST